MNLTRRKCWIKAIIGILAIPSATQLQMSPAAKQQPSISIHNDEAPRLSSPQTRIYHQPPPNVSYTENSSVFGAILRGQNSCLTLKETSNALAFQDRSPKAPLHALVIPKMLIKNVFALDHQKHLPLLNDMHAVAKDLIKTYHPQALESNDYILCYHVPPFNSVEHLHLHVLAPASKMNWLFRFTKYMPGTRWCTSDEQVRTRLQAGKPAVPFHNFGYD